MTKELSVNSRILTANSRKSASSLQPPGTSPFVIDKDINLNNYYEIVRDYADNLIEEVKILDEYENEEKFGKDKKSYTFRIVYRSSERTLTNEEINQIQEKIRTKTEKELGALLR